MEPLTLILTMNFSKDFDWDNHRTPSRKMRDLVIERDGNVCRYCCRVININYLTVDHVVPFSRGGKTVMDNLVVACKKCNQKKSNYLPQEIGMILIPQLNRLD